ncbi:MAG: globin domain-containing protein [Pseudomonadota bacterium]
MSGFSASDRETIQRSWRRLAPFVGLVGTIFYGRLFAIAPDVRPVFESAIDEQAAKLTDTLSVVVQMIDGEDQFGGDLEALAVRHIAYGSLPAHYDAVGNALIWTLDTTLPGGLQAHERAAWERAYAWERDLMVNARAEPPRLAARLAI